MAAPAGSGAVSHYVADLSTLVRCSAWQLVAPASAPRRVEALRFLARRLMLMLVIAGVAIITLMFEFDLVEIQLMPPRGTPGLWPARILTDFGKDGYVLGALATILVAAVLLAPWWRDRSGHDLRDLATRLQFLLFAVLVPVMAGEIVKWIAGRGRPFVGGKTDVFNFVPFAGTEAHAAFPSAHAITGFALAFAVGALWPRARTAMIAYAVLIAFSRLVLLAHHPSDVVAGALIGIIGAMLVRYWFAARGILFSIRDDGEIVPSGRSS
jgi:undecaprenyl-diphosphatase